MIGLDFFLIGIMTLSYMSPLIYLKLLFCIILIEFFLLITILYAQLIDELALELDFRSKSLTSVLIYLFIFEFDYYCYCLFFY